MTLCKQFLQQKETIFGLLAALAFQLIFSLVWLTGYEGVNDRTDHLRIGIVNEDPLIGQQISEAIMAEDYFSIEPFPSLAEGEKQLAPNGISMLIHIGPSISASLQAKEPAIIDYYLNQSTPAIEKQTMEKVAKEMQEQINQALMGAEKQEPLSANYIKTSQQTAFVYTMVPLLIVLASFIGAMLISQHFQFTSDLLQATYALWAIFLTRQIMNVLAAGAIGLVTSLIMGIFHIELGSSFFKVWAFQTLLMFTFLLLSQIWVILLGNLGMVFNIALTALQLVSSGAIVPVKLLPGFYEMLSIFLPATYGVNGYLHFIYGGGHLLAYVHLLLIISGGSLVLACLALAIRQVFTKRDVTVQA